MGGMHVGAQWTRFFDALLVAVLATGSIGLFSSSGIDVTSKKLVAAPDMTALVRKSAIAIASAFLLYAGLRILRVALVAPHRAAHLPGAALHAGGRGLRRRAKAPHAGRWARDRGRRRRHRRHGRAVPA